MKIALIGYGKMGRAIETIALKRGHTITATIDLDNTEMFDSDAFRSANVAIEFTTPQTAYDNCLKCCEANIPVVCGTTGWTDNTLRDMRQRCEQNDRTFFHSSNFSLGVKNFFALNKYLAKIMNSYPDYNVGMTEIHHIHKLDAPSGTAITLAEGIIEDVERLKGWSSDNTTGEQHLLHINAIRQGEVPGIHEICYQSDIDSITVKHDAKNRTGFALGAVVAAEFAANHKGFLTMNDMLKF
ncbi:MAG: 4-hydroxy-tetrahydrodipicolinate reductase [Tannerella sp.]|jgi:4-hydroxy-tetrahydrodipicolinate reductase|nr:4-hydroxy-tetrahydrodipicolinate reductase [Tannerella sp.]